MNSYEELLSLIQARRSVRKFTAQPVSREDILRVLEAAKWAPSNHNRQPWKFIVYEDSAQIEALAKTVSAGLSGKLKALPQIARTYAGEILHFATFFGDAPALLVVLHKRPASFTNALLQYVDHSELVSGEPLSAAMAVQNLLLAAHASGLGACVLTAPLIARDTIVRDLHLPDGYELTCFVALGHPGETPAPPRRKSIEHIAEFRNDGGRPDGQ